MPEYGVYEAKTKLADLIRQVQQGGSVTITNRGEPVAELVAATGRTARQTEEAIAAIKSIRSAGIDQAKFFEMRARGRR